MTNHTRAMSQAYKPALIDCAHCQGDQSAEVERENDESWERWLAAHPEERS